MKIVFCFLVAAVFVAGCGGSGSGHSRTDANGRHDLSGDEVLALLGAIAQACPASTTEVTQAQCEATCDCSVTAAAQLDGTAPTQAALDDCKAPCDPEFQSTDDDPIHEDDADDDADYQNFFHDYILACDEIAHQVVHGDAAFVDECIDTCECIADHMENTISETEDDELRASCEAQCGAAAPRSASATMEMFVRAGM